MEKVAMRKTVLAVIAGLVAPLLTLGASGTPNIAGRWDFEVSSGDTTIQLNAMGGTEFETYLLQNGSTLSNILIPTSDTTECDSISDGNITATGTVLWSRPRA